MITCAAAVTVVYEYARCTHVVRACLNAFCRHFLVTALQYCIDCLHLTLWYPKIFVYSAAQG